MESKRLKSLPSIALLAVVCTLCIGEHSVAADRIWKVTPAPGALFSCQGVTQVCIALHSVLVKKTPGDPGTKEEWVVKLGTDPGGVSMTKRINVKDEYSGPGLDYYLGLRFCLPNQYGAFEMSVKGYEEDMWPNPDDSIPHTKIVVVNMCSSVQEFQEDAAASRISVCKKDSDGDREACYNFGGDYE